MQDNVKVIMQGFRWYNAIDGAKANGASLGRTNQGDLVSCSLIAVSPSYPLRTSRTPSLRAPHCVVAVRRNSMKGIGRKGIWVLLSKVKFP